MKRKPAEIVSGVGVFVSLITELDKRVRTKGGTNEDWHRLVKPEGESTLDRIADLIVLPGNLGDIYPVSIQRASLEEMIAAGHYDWVNSNITAEHFPLDDSQFGDFKLVLVHLNRVATTPEVLAYMKERNLEPGKIGHLLGFGAKNPEIQREFPILALGSSWVDPGGGSGVPGLGSIAPDRVLLLHWNDDHWSDNCRFLALSK